MTRTRRFSLTRVSTFRLTKKTARLPCRIAESAWTKRICRTISEPLRAPAPKHFLKNCLPTRQKIPRSSDSSAWDFIRRLWRQKKSMCIRGKPLPIQNSCTGQATARIRMTWTKWARTARMQNASDSIRRTKTELQSSCT